jgi:hypothetical protein
VFLNSFTHLYITGKWLKRIPHFKTLTMKKRNLFYLIAFLFMAQSVAAQFGVHGGVSLSSMTFQYDDFGETEKETFGSRAGFLFGGFYRHQFSSNFAIQPELNFVQRGGKEEIDFFGETFKTDFNLNYLEIPINFLYTTSDFGGFYIGAGPSLNFGLSGKVKVTFDGETESEDIKFGKDEDLKGFYLGANILTGYQFENGLNLSAFFTQSFTNSSPQAEIDAENAKTSFMNYGLRIGYTFGGGGMDRATAKNKLKQVL